MLTLGTAFKGFKNKEEKSVGQSDNKTQTHWKKEEVGYGPFIEEGSLYPRDTG